MEGIGNYDIISSRLTNLVSVQDVGYRQSASLFMFTKGQADRMNSHLVTGGESDSLTLFPEILEWPTSIGGLALENSVQIYPNPSEGTFTVQAGKEKELRRIDIFDISGRLVYSRVADPAARTGYSIELTEVPKGIYLVRCIFAEGTVARKITIQ